MNNKQQGVNNMNSNIKKVGALAMIIAAASAIVMGCKQMPLEE
jgi:hypothetical protein